jgi:hypothetical protein
MHTWPGRSRNEYLDFSDVKPHRRAGKLDLNMPTDQFLGVELPLATSTTRGGVAGTGLPYGFALVDIPLTSK